MCSIERLLHYAENSLAKCQCYTHIFCSHAVMGTCIMFQETLPWHQLSREGSISSERGTGNMGQLSRQKLVLVQCWASKRHYITRDAHSSYKVNPNCALCIGQKNFFNQFHCEIARFFFHHSFFSGHFFPLDFPLQLVLETKTMTQ